VQKSCVTIVGVPKETKNWGPPEHN